MAVGLLATIRDLTLNLLFPPRCEVCGLLQEPVICDNCLARFDGITSPFCQQCGLPFDPLAQSADHCAECHNDPPPFDVARAAGVYGGALRRAIHVLKYDMISALAVPLADFAVTHIDLPFPVNCLCPVPLYPARQRMRGFNQSMLLAEQFGRHWGIPVEENLLTRTINTVPQMLLPLDERRRNIRGAFTTKRKLRGQTIGLVDDVLTTGSTLRECSRILKRAGADRVVVLALARTIRQGPDFPDA